MLWIGITGPMGGGKSTVAAELRSMGFPVIDADDVARKVLGPGTVGEAAVLRTFGLGLQGSDGILDRRALGRIVFADEEKLRQLEALVHPLVRQEVAALRAQMEKAGHAAAFYDVPLLFEKNMENQFDMILVVTARPEIRHARIKERMKLSDTEIFDRESKQLPSAVKEEKAARVFDNNGDLADLRAELGKFLAGVKLR